MILKVSKERRTRLRNKANFMVASTSLKPNFHAGINKVRVSFVGIPKSINADQFERGTSVKTVYRKSNLTAFTKVCLGDGCELFGARPRFHGSAMNIPAAFSSSRDARLLRHGGERASSWQPPCHSPHNKTPLRSTTTRGQCGHCAREPWKSEPASINFSLASTPLLARNSTGVPRPSNFARLLLKPSPTRGSEASG